MNSLSVSRGFLFRYNLLPIIRSLFSNSPHVEVDGGREILRSSHWKTNSPCFVVILSKPIMRIDTKNTTKLVNSSKRTITGLGQFRLELDHIYFPFYQVIPFLEWRQIVKYSLKVESNWFLLSCRITILSIDLGLQDVPKANP